MRTWLGLIAVVALTIWTEIGVAAPINFTGGTATFGGGGTGVTSNVNVFSNVNFYTQAGFHFDFIGGNEYAGTYYGGNNDVLHWHSPISLKVSRVDGGSFDLNSFTLTSNTQSGGGTATGNEIAYINASVDGTTIAFSQLLPPESWGLVGLNPTINLGSEFDNVKWVSFTIDSNVFCLGIDNFDATDPATVPEPISIVMWMGAGSVGLALRYRRRKPIGA